MFIFLVYDVKLVSILPHNQILKLFISSWNGYNDELVWGAAWLYKATGDVSYFNKAKKYYNDFNLEGQTGVFSWDDKTVGVHALMAEFTGESKYTNSLKKFCDHAVS